MSNSKEINTNVNNNTDINNKKSSIPVIVGTGAILFAGVMSCDVNVTSQMNTLLTNNIISYSQGSQAQLEVQSNGKKDNKKKTCNKNSCYFTNSNGQLLYDSDAEDDLAYYGDWDRVSHNDNKDIDDYEVFIY